MRLSGTVPENELFANTSRSTGEKRVSDVETVAKLQEKAQATDLPRIARPSISMGIVPVMLVFERSRVPTKDKLRLSNS